MPKEKERLSQRSPYLCYVRVHSSVLVEPCLRCPQCKDSIPDARGFCNAPGGR